MKTNEKIDLYKLHKQEYAASRKPALVNVKEAAYLAVTGQGEPGGAAFTDKIGALCGVAYTVKMTRKFAGQQDYAVCKLEGQWWCGDAEGDFTNIPKDQWRWKLLIRTPTFIQEEELGQAMAVLLKRGKNQSVQEVALESLSEGLCVQMLHVGPYDREPETIAVMRAFAEKNGLKFHGRHHEIYLSDPRRVPPERLKTILRLPVTKS
ncbi:MAG: GyrI-like domain-containing protein [Verrucomicrobiota bacterium]